MKNAGREIKFRAWWIEKKTMLYNVHLFYDQLDERLHGNEYEPEQNFGNILNNPKYIVQQYTDFNDKNNKEIYEGDILKFIESHEEDCDCEHCFPCSIDELVVVKWVDDGFMILPLSSDFIGEGELGFLCENCCAKGRLMTPNHEIPIGCFTKIIGNIYENPELLNAQNSN